MPKLAEYVEKLHKLELEMDAIYAESGLIATYPEVQITQYRMTEIAPLSEWELNGPFIEGHFIHRVTIDGIRVITISDKPIETEHEKL